MCLNGVMRIKNGGTSIHHDNQMSGKLRSSNLSFRPNKSWHLFFGTTKESF